MVVSYYHSRKSMQLFKYEFQWDSPLRRLCRNGVGEYAYKLNKSHTLFLREITFYMHLVCSSIQVLLSPHTNVGQMVHSPHIQGYST